MIGSGKNVTFTASRLKMLPSGLAFTLLSLLFGFGVVELVFRARHGVTAEGLAGFGFTALIFGVCIYAEIQTIRFFLSPDSLTLSPDGISISTLEKTESYPWADLGEPDKIWKSSGRGGSHYISLSRPSGEPLLVPGESYVEPFDDVMTAIRSARSASASPMAHQGPGGEPSSFGRRDVALHPR